MKRALLLSLLWTVASPAAAVYQCKSPGGTTVFQDAPCEGGGGKQLQVRPAAGDAPPPPADTTAGDDARQRLDRMRQQLDTATRERRVREIGYEIRDSEREIERLNKAMVTDLDALKAQKQRARNNLAGATWEASVSQEMEATAQKYRTQIETERGTIQRLEQERDRLTAPQ